MYFIGGLYIRILFKYCLINILISDNWKTFIIYKKYIQIIDFQKINQSICITDFGDIWDLPTWFK